MGVKCLDNTHKSLVHNDLNSGIMPWTKGSRLAQYGQPHVDCVHKATRHIDLIGFRSVMDSGPCWPSVIRHLPGSVTLTFVVSVFFTFTVMYRICYIGQARKKLKWNLSKTPVRLLQGLNSWSKSVELTVHQAARRVSPGCNLWTTISVYSW